MPSQPTQAGKTMPDAGKKLHRLCRLFRRERRGAAVVEFALVVPVFVALLFGMIEFGRMVMVQQVLTNASREGARQAVLDGTTPADITSTVNSYLLSAGISGATITMNPNPPSGAANGVPVTITVSIPFTQVSWLSTPMYLNGQTLQAATVMRREASN